MKSLKVEKKRRLYVSTSEGGGVSCLGFDRLHKLGALLANDLGERWEECRGTKKAYKRYKELCKKGALLNKETGWRSKAELHFQLVGLEGCRVKVVDADGEEYRFLVGKSTGWMPCHLQIHNVRSTGGPAVDSRPFKSVCIIFDRR